MHMCVHTHTHTFNQIHALFQLLQDITKPIVTDIAESAISGEDEFLIQRPVKIVTGPLLSSHMASGLRSGLLTVCGSLTWQT